MALAGILIGYITDLACLFVYTLYVCPFLRPVYMLLTQKQKATL